MIKNYFWMLVLGAGLQTSWGFALLGPETLPNGADAWQTTVIGYHLASSQSSLPGGPMYMQDIGGPRNIRQEYRRNDPVIYYTYDASFWDFFGSNGVAVVDSAVAIMNAITNVDQMNFAHYPLDSQHFNYQAESLYLTDLKSTALHLFLEQLGLAQPERFTWTLQDRYLPSGGKCPVNEEYLVVQRNYAETNTPLNQIQYSAYVNNILYTYEILEACTGPDPLAITEPFSVDPLSDEYTAVADSSYETLGGLQIGGYYNNLSQDDVAGLQYLMTSNHINWERAATGSLLFDVATNYNSPKVLFPANPDPTLPPSSLGFGTFNYATLLAAAAGTPPALLPLQFPGLVVASSQNYYILTNVPTVTGEFIPPPIGYPVGTAPTFVLVTNYTTTWLQQYATTFANVVPVVTNNHAKAILQTITTGPKIGYPVGTLVTTTNYQTITLPTNTTYGDFYVLPLFGTNLCPPGIIFGVTNVIYTTNLVASAATNVVTTNATLYSTTQYVITWYTNHTYETYAVNCGQTPNATGLFEGIEHVRFVRHDYDSLLGQYFQPVTNGYTMMAVTNSQSFPEHFDRAVTAPDILLTGYNLANGSPGIAWTGPGNGTVDRTITFDTSQLVAGGNAGPGVIDPTSLFQFDNLGSAVWNGYDINNFFLNQPIAGIWDETMQVPSVAWGSFDGTTNDPVVYPNGTSILNVSRQVLTQVTITNLDNNTLVTSLPAGTNGVAYPNLQFGAVAPRLTAPFTWSAANLPPGLSLTAAGLLSGTPIDQTGGYNSPLVYDITLILTDSLSNSVQWNYPIIIQ